MTTLYDFKDRLWLKMVHILSHIIVCFARFVTVSCIIRIRYYNAIAVLGENFEVCTQIKFDKLCDFLSFQKNCLKVKANAYEKFRKV